jgi:hypothetical protein
MGERAVSERIAVRDRRELPFVMVRLDALEAIRAHAAGLARARALGLYALLCLLANEQRAVGERRRLTASRDVLCARARIGSSSLAAAKRLLVQSAVARWQTGCDERGAPAASTIELLVQDRGFVALSVASITLLLERSPTPLPPLAMFVTLLEVCERTAPGETAAEISRSELAGRLGCSLDTLDRWSATLRSLGVLRTERRADPRGHGYLPTLWTILEPNVPTGISEPTYPQQETDLAANGDRPARSRGPAQPQLGTDGPASEDRPARPAPTPGPALRLHARARIEGETEGEDLSPPTPSSAQSGGGEGELAEPVRRLCDALLGALAVRGPGPQRRYDARPALWHAAARRILADIPLERVLEALAYLPGDQVIGTRVRGMPELEEHLEELLFRCAAAPRHAALHSTASVRPGGALPWASAKALLQQAAAAGGARSDAAERLQREHPRLAQFARAFGWRRLREMDLARWDFEVQPAYRHHIQDEEAA